MGPLAGTSVVELAGIGPAPFCAMLLADMGADVIRVERPAAGGKGANFRLGIDPVNRGRQTIAVDLKTPEGQQVVKRLASRADVLIEGFRPGVMERLGLGPDECLALNPRLVYSRMTGWGQTGPLAHSAGHDINYISLTGALHSIGPRGSEPAIPLNLLGDYAGGSLYLGFGIVCALLESRSSGKGQVVDAAIVDGTSSLMTLMYALRGQGLWDDARGTNLLDGGRPWYSVYETGDRLHVSVGAIEDQFYARLTDLMGFRPGELPDRKNPDSWPEIRRRFAEKFRSRTREEWCATLEGHDACFAPVLSMEDAPLHPHMKARGGFVNIEGITVPAPAPRFSRSSPRDVQAQPGGGATLAGMLMKWGFSAEEAGALEKHHSG